MKQSHSVAAAVIVFAAIASLLYFSLFAFHPQQRFTVEFQETVFESDSMQPQTHLKQLSAEYTYFVSPEVFGEQGNYRDAVNVLTAFQAVLIFSDKNAVSLLREVDEKTGKIISCNTNHGNRYVDEEIPFRECSAILSSDKGVKVIVHRPDSSLPKNQVLLSGKKVEVFPRFEAEASGIYLLILKAMFKDSQTVIDYINSLT